MPIARNRYLGIAQEKLDEYGVLPANPNWVYFDISSSDLDAPADEKLIWRSATNRAPVKVAPGPYSTSGNFVIPCDGKLFGWILKFAFGQVVTSDYSGAKKHIFKPKDTLPSFSIRVGKDIFEHEFSGCIINELKVEVDKEFALATIGTVGIKDKKNEVCTIGVHKVKDNVNVTSSPIATDLTTARTLANEIKSDYNAHRVSTTYHVAGDMVNGVTSVDATDQTTLNTLVNEIKTDINAHRSQSNIHLNDDAAHKINSENATDLPTSLTLVNEIRSKYNGHLQEVQIDVPSFIHRFDRTSFLLGGITAQPAEKITFTLNNNAKTDEGIRLGSRFPVFYDIGDREVTIDGDLTFETTGQLERFWGEVGKTEPVTTIITTSQFDVKFSGMAVGSTFNDLKFSIPKMVYTSIKQPISKRDRIKQAFTGKAIFKDYTDYDVTAEYINDVTSYPDPA